MRRPGGVDQYPDVTVNWKLHFSPTLHVYDSGTGKEINSIGLSSLNAVQLHALFEKYFRRAKVAPPNLFVRTWRRLFGWAYGVSTLEATVLFVCGGAALAVACYAMCFKYTAICDGLSDL